MHEVVTSAARKVRDKYEGFCRQQPADLCEYLYNGVCSQGPTHLMAAGVARLGEAGRVPRPRMVTSTLRYWPHGCKKTNVWRMNIMWKCTSAARASKHFIGPDFDLSPGDIYWGGSERAVIPPHCQSDQRVW